MLKKIKVLASVALLGGLLATSSATPASAFPDFNFGMNNRGPFMMFKDGPNFWLFNMDNPFGRYGSTYNRRAGYNNFYQARPNNFFGGNNRSGRWPGGSVPWSSSQWPNSQWGNSPWNGNRWGGNPWNNRSPWGGNSPWGGGSPWGGSPWSGSPWSSGSSPWGGSPWNSGMRPWGGTPSWNPVTGISPFGSPFGGFSPF